MADIHTSRYMSADCQQRKLAGPFASAIANHRDPANSDLAPNPVLYYRIATLKICVIRTVHTRQNRIERLAPSNAKSPPYRRVLSNAAITLLPQTSSRLDSTRTWYEPAAHGDVGTKLHRVSHWSISTLPSIDCPHAEAMVIACKSSGQSNGPSLGKMQARLCAGVDGGLLVQPMTHIPRASRTA